jgi:hypothetical protein
LTDGKKKLGRFMSELNMQRNYMDFEQKFTTRKDMQRKCR